MNELLDRKSLVDSYLKKGPRPLAAFSFISIFAWGDFFQFEFKTIDGCLCIFASQGTRSFMYLPPLGSAFSEATIKSAFDHMRQGKPFSSVNRIENISENLLSVFNHGQYNHYTKPLEYVYRKEDLSKLQGNAYKSKRHDCNCFVSRHAGWTFEPYTDGDFSGCMDLYGQWAKERAASHTDEIYTSMLEENVQVHSRLLTHAKALDLVVRVLKIDGKLVGYTFGYALDEDTFCVYAEIADLSVTGAAAFMFKSFCADEQLKPFSRINTMDDFAMPNIAHAKKSYHPSEMIASYTVSLKESP